MTPEIIERDEFIVVGIRTVHEMGFEGAASLWEERFLPRQNEVKGLDRHYYGVFNFLPNDHEGRIEYVAGVVTDSLENIPLGMVGWVLPMGTYAEITAAGLAASTKAYRDLITEWLPDSGFQVVNSPMFAYTADKHPGSRKAMWKVNIPVETPDKLARYETWLREN